MRRNNRFPGLSGIAMVLFLFLLFPCLYAQLYGLNAIYYNSRLSHRHIGVGADGTDRDIVYTCLLYTSCFANTTILRLII